MRTIKRRRYLYKPGREDDPLDSYHDSVEIVGGHVHDVLHHVDCGEVGCWAVRRISEAEALEEGLVIVDELGDRMPAVIGYSRISKTSGALRQRRDEGTEEFLRRLSSIGEEPVYYARLSYRSEVEKKGVRLHKDDLNDDYWHHWG